MDLNNYMKLSVFLFVPLAVGCSGVNFGNSGPSTMSVTASGTGGTGTGTGVTGQGNPVTTPTPTPTSSPLPNAPLAQVPVVTLTPHDCVAGNPCILYADLSAAQTEDLAADWATNNTIYTQTPPAGVAYAAPNVDYIPTAGTINFPAGVTHIEIEIMTIVDPTPLPAGVTSNLRTIVVDFSDCTYDAIQYNCQSLGM